MSEAAIPKAMEAARVFLSSTEERRLYINREMARMDRESQLEEAHEKGFEKGIISLALCQIPEFMTKMHLSLPEAMDLLYIPENLRQAVQEALAKKSNK